MNTLGQVIGAIIQDARQGDEAILAKIVQRHYYALCGRTWWQSLRNKVTLTMTGSTSGQMLPADLIGILAVIGSDGSPYEAVARVEAGYANGFRSWLYVETPTASLDVIVPSDPTTGGVTVGENGSSFSGATLGGTRTGEYIRFGQEPGVYKLTGAASFTPAYRGAALSNVPAVVRPSSTRFLNITQNQSLAADTVTVYYWAYPEPLYQTWQEIMLPATRALELMCIIDLVGGQERMRGQADAFRSELEHPVTRVGAYQDMLALDPQFNAPSQPMNRDRQRFMFGRRR